MGARRRSTGACLTGGRGGRYNKRFLSARPASTHSAVTDLRDQIAQWLLGYTKAQGAPGGPADVPEAERDDRFFSAVIPKVMLPELRCLPEARA